MMNIYALLASRADVVTLSVVIRFAKYQRSASASIRIAKDDIVEKTESLQLRLTLPSSDIKRNLLKYGSHRYATVYIKDSEFV